MDVANLLINILKVADGDMTVQNLDHCVDGILLKKGVATVKFKTDQPISKNGYLTKNLGIVLWIDRDLFSRCLDEESVGERS